MIEKILQYGNYILYVFNINRDQPNWTFLVVSTETKKLFVLFSTETKLYYQD